MVFRGRLKIEPFLPNSVTDDVLVAFQKLVKGNAIFFGGR